MLTYDRVCVIISCMNKKSFHFYLDNDLKKDLQKLADGRTLTYMINKAIKEFVANQKNR